MFFFAKSIKFSVRFVIFPEKGAKQLIDQILGFGTEKHDDLMDAFTMLINKIMKDNKEPIDLELWHKFQHDPRNKSIMGNIWKMEF